MSCFHCGNPSQGTPAPTPTEPFDPLDYLQPGYPKLAGRMSLLPQIAMFKRFSALNARNLLYLQSELILLEERLRIVEIEDAMNPDSDKKNNARDYYCLHYSEYIGPDTKQLNLFKKIGEVLKEYSLAHNNDG